MKILNLNKKFKIFFLILIFECERLNKILSNQRIKQRKLAISCSNFDFLNSSQMVLLFFHNRSISGEASCCSAASSCGTPK
jgi:hypothetical protein